MSKKENFENIRSANLNKLQHSVDDKISIRDARNFYNRNNIFFEKTLDILEKLGWFDVEDGIIIRRKPYDEENFSVNLIKTLKKNSSEYGTFFKEFIGKFKEENQYSYSPDLMEQNRYKYLLDFLKDPSINVIEKQDSNFNINQNFIKIFEKPKKSLEKFKEEQKLNEEVGSAAEYEIMEYEKKRLEQLIGKNHLPRQVSLENVGAGYDIQSYDIVKEDIIKIFIEVKSYKKNGVKKKFYWSKNEINVAKDLGEKYYLYLLPNDGPKKIFIDELTRICNPYIEIYENKSAWKGVVSEDMFFEEI